MGNANQDEHGQVYLDDDSGTTVTIASADVYVELAAGNVAISALSRFSAPVASTGRITLAKGTHLVMISATVDMTSAKEIYMTALKNGVAGESPQILTGLLGDGERECMSAFGLVSSDGDDYVSLGFMNTTDTTNIVVHQASIVAIGLDTNPPRPGTP